MITIFITFHLQARRMILTDCEVCGVIKVRGTPAEQRHTGRVSELLSILNTDYNKRLIVGDFNLHIDNRNDNKATDLINLLDNLGFMQHVHGPTHNHGHTLDLSQQRVKRQSCLS